MRKRLITDIENNVKAQYFDDDAGDWKLIEKDDIIQELREENERLRDALEQIAEPRDIGLSVVDDLTNRCVVANESLRGDAHD